MTQSQTPTLPEVVDVLRLYADPAPWDDPEAVRREAAELLGRLLEHGLLADDATGLIVRVSR